LGRVGTSVLSRAAGTEIECMYAHGMWTHRIGGYFFPDSIKFEYKYIDFNDWVGKADLYISQAKDFWFWSYKPRPGDTIVDVGAGRGEDTLAFSKAVGPTGRVIAIEAHPFSFNVLKNFCLLNGLSNVTPIHSALMDRPGTVRIAESASSWTENSVLSGGRSWVEVRAKTMDEIFREQELNEIDLLKMNIEGAERHALIGMASVMPHVRRICVASHDFRGELGHGEEFRTRAFVEHFLGDHGFTLMSRPDDPREYVRGHVFGLRSV
jgi:FkbM family methyltransferase